MKKQTTAAQAENPLGTAPVGSLIAKFAIPAIISNMKVNIGLSLVGVIIGEFLAAKAGLGYLIIYGSQVFKMDWVMLSIVLLCLIAALLYGVLNRLEKHFRNF